MPVVPPHDHKRIEPDRSCIDAGFPFPCILGDPCEDGPTFLALCIFPYSGPADVVCSDPLALDACLVCDSVSPDSFPSATVVTMMNGACCTAGHLRNMRPCSRPQPMPGFDAIVQSVAISDTQVTLQLQSSVVLEVAQFETSCTLGNEWS